jgi:hypothetical protein
MTQALYAHMNNKRKMKKKKEQDLKKKKKKISFMFLISLIPTLRRLHSFQMAP